VFAGVLGLCAVAMGYFSARGLGTASATVGSLNPPQNVTVRKIAADVMITWDASAGSSDIGVQGYRVSRSDGAAVCGATTLVTTVTCMDSSPPSGTYTYTVTSVYNSFTASATSDPVTVAQPSVVLGPSSAHVGDSITITGSAFPPASAITATYDGDALALTPAGSSTNDSGSIPGGLTFTAPAGTGGAHEISVSAGGRSASVAFTVASQISLSAATGVAGSTDTITGTGFASASPITVTVAGVTVPLTGGTTDASGDFWATYTVPDQAPGTQTVVATDGSANAAATGYRIDTPSIELSLTSGHVSDSVQITGWNFAQNIALSATYDGGALSLSGPDATDPMGSISTGVTFAVPASTAGAHTVQINAGGASASATISVSPQITLAPGIGAVGSVGSIDGTGFAADLTLVAALGTTTVALTGTTTTNSAGSFSGATYLVPAGAAGNETAEVDDSATPTPNTATGTFTITPQITLTPTTAPAGSTVSVSGAGFSAGETITATFGGSFLALGGSTTTDASGSLSGATYTVPVGAAGSYPLALQDASGNSAAAGFTVEASATVLSPTSATAGATASIAAHDFAPDSALTVTVGGATATITSGATTDAVGSSAVSFTIPALANGNHTVVVHDASFDSATATTSLTVDAQLTLSPATGVAGTTDTITGTGFAADSAITATFDGSSVAVTGGASDTSGSFAATYTVPNLAPGAEAVVATDASSDATGTTYTITPRRSASTPPAHMSATRSRSPARASRPTAHSPPPTTAPA
jgi:hypothetical protein